MKAYTHRLQVCQLILNSIIYFFFILVTHAVISERVIVLRTNIQLCNTRVVVADLRSLVHPRVDVNVLVLCVLLQRVGYKHVIELLRLHVK